MTFRARPVAQRNPKPSWESRDRRNFLLNLGFGLAVLVALLILVIAVGWYYYNDHLVSVGKVDGQSISKDELRDRVLIERWRLTEATNRVRTELAAGHLTESQAQQQDQYIQQQQNQLAAISLERIIDNRIQARLAGEEGVAVSDADIDARLTEEATIKESRHAWQIEVQPESAAGAAPTTEQIAAARTKVNQALTDIKGGKSWDDIAKTVSTDSATAPQAGDLGWIGKDDTQTDEAFLTAMFAAEQGAPTDVVEGEDGIFRIGRITEIAPESVDGVYQDKIVNEGIDLAKYRTVVRGDVIRKKLEDKLVADAAKPAPQRETSEIYLSQATIDLPDEAVKVRHILYSPNDDAQAAQNMAPDDPAWTVAKLAAEKDYEILKKDPSKFDEMARTNSDDQSAQGETGNGGKLPYVDSDGRFVSAFADAVLDKPELKPGDILAPVKSEFGFHIIQIMYRPPDLDQMNRIRELAAAGTDFATLARDNSDGPEAGKGGDKGWVGEGLIDARLLRAILETPVDALSQVVEIKSAGTFLYEVLEERTQAPDADQLVEIKARAFQNWYGEKKDAVKVTRELLAEAAQG